MVLGIFCQVIANHMQAHVMDSLLPLIFFSSITTARDDSQLLHIQQKNYECVCLHVNIIVCVYVCMCLSAVYSESKIV